MTRRLSWGQMLTGRHDIAHRACAFHHSQPAREASTVSTPMHLDSSWRRKVGDEIAYQRRLTRSALCDSFMLNLQLYRYRYTSMSP